MASAATVAASSLEMKVRDPKPYLDAIDRVRLRKLLGCMPKAYPKGPTYVEPSGNGGESATAEVQNSTTATEAACFINSTKSKIPSNDIKRGKIQVLGDFIDTDALAPAEVLTACKTNAEFGAHCLEHTHPYFRSRAAEGYNVVVAGTAFGCGSSRENAVSALLGCGVKAVVAKSFAFIYGRNAPNLGLLGIVIKDEGFYENVKDGGEVEVDLGMCVVRLFEGGEQLIGEWSFEMSDIEKELIEIRGLTNAFRKFGKGLFDVLTTPKGKRGSGKVVENEKSCGSVGDFQW